MKTDAPVSGDWRRLQRWRGYVDSVAFLLLAILRKVATPVLVRLLSVKNNGSVIIDPLPFSPFLYIYFFLTKSSFLQGRNLGWCDVSVLDSVFVGSVLFYLLCFSLG